MSVKFAKPYIIKTHSVMQLVVDAYGCKGELDSEYHILENIITAAHAVGAHIVKKDVHKYSPQGVSATLVLAESHLSIHTWPELGYATVDIFFCNINMEPQKSWKIIEGFLKPEKLKTHNILHQIDTSP